MEPRILAFCGSMRKNGNTAILLNETLRGASDAGASTEMVYLSDYDIRYCDGCEECYINDGKDLGTCHIQDDMTKILIPKIIEANAVIFGTPSYWSNVSALMKNFIDRMIVFTYDRGDCGPAPRLKPGRKAMLYVVGAVSYRVSSFGGAHFLPFEAMRIICLFSNIEVVDFLTAAKVDKPGDIRSQGDILARAYEQGKILATMF